MQHGSHPPGETLHFPHPAQTNLRVTIEQVAFAIAVELGQRLRQHSYIGYRKIESLRSGRRDNMGGIPSQKKFSILHRFDDEAAHASDPFLDYGSFHKFPSARGLQPHVQFFPDFFVRPFHDVLGRIALDIQPA